MATVLYRKYRPKKFEDIRGQSHVVTTLKNALKKEEIAHAYLLAGPRGTGKTSMARILASSLGISGPDLIEIDAASFRGIDKMREIKESVGFRPIQSDKKMYILDEAHMLTTEAFNALLKTLEEPPNYVHFVLCTTEPHKIPVTVMSRCHRFSFNLADENELSDFVQSIAKDEKAKIDDEASKMIAKLAKGSYRDAVVLIEQAIGLAGGKEINPIILEQGLGLVRDGDVGQLLALLEQKDARALLATLETLGNDGGSYTYILDKLIEHVVNSMSGGTGGSSEAMGRVKLLDVLLSARRKMQYLQNPKHALVSEMMKYIYSNESAGKVTQSSENQLTDTESVIEDEVKDVDEPTKAEEVPEPVSTSVSEEIEAPVEVQASNINPATQFDEVDWVKLMALVKEKKSSVEALLKGGRPQGFDSKGRYVLLFTYTFHKEKIEQMGNLKIVEQVLSEMLNRKVAVKCILDESGKKKGNKWDDSKSVKVSKEKRTKNKSPKSTHGSQNEDLLKLAQDVFGGQLIE